ncbi:MAG: hypothetical protein IKK24_06285 [Clostridia bacterium]|nr:hypothetical protein [Clostridia bacterium]
MKLFRDTYGADANCAVCFWNWNSDITEEGILSQLKDYADGRIGGVIIHARAGLKIPYMGNRWMELFRYAVQQAEQLSLEVWIYDEDGWPSGFASGRVPALGEEYCFKKLQYAFVGDADMAYVDPDKVVAVYGKAGEEYKQIKDFSLDNLSEGTVVFWYSMDAHYVDLLNPKVTEAFIEFTHERYKTVVGDYFGTVVKGFFTDEPQMNTSGYVYSHVLIEEYKNRTGRDFLDDMWKIAVNSESSYVFRNELWSVTSDLYFNNFVKKLSCWCDNNNLKLTGHFPAEDGLINQLPACGELMRNYSLVQLPAIDHLGSRVASPVLMKQVSSVSRQYRDGNVLSETFGCAGWGVSFKRLQWIWGGQSVLGVTKPCYHLSAYSIEGRRKRDYPAFYSYQEPWWDDFRSFASWMNNLNRFMSEGTRELSTLVIPPVSSMKYLYEDDFHCGGVPAELSSDFRRLVENLLDLQLDFDLGDEGLICKDAVVAGGRLTLGNISYDTMIISHNQVITKEFYHILKEFVRVGGKLFISDSVPTRFTDGSLCDFSDIDKTILVNRRNTMEKYIEGMGINRSVTVARTDNLKPISGVYLHTRLTAKGRMIHIWPGEDFATANAYLRFGTAAVPYKVNLIDGSRERLLRLDGRNDYLVPITVTAGENLVIELVNGEVKPLPEYQFSSSNAVNSFDIKLCEPNCITLDKASVSTDGGKTFGLPQQILQILNSIYADNRTEVLNVILRYRFNLKEGVNKNSITLGLEDGGCYTVRVNGKTVSGTRKDWWIDYCIGIYNIGDMLKDGENIIDLYYEIPPIRSDRSLLNVFETEMNRFYYPIEPDSIYVRGDFDVLADAKVYNNGYCYQTDGQFTVVPRKEKKIGDLTKQGMWFYRGNVNYDFTFNIGKKKDKTVIEVESYKGVMLALNIGGKRLISHSCPAVFDITDLVKCGKNEATLELIGHNRNLLGPHHYINGESFMVCPATFEGRWDCLAEFLSPWLYNKSTGTEDYGFIPFGIEDVKVKEYIENH